MSSTCLWHSNVNVNVPCVCLCVYLGIITLRVGEVGAGAKMKLIVNMVRTPLDAILVRFVVEAQVTHFHLVEVDRVRDWYLNF